MTFVELIVAGLATWQIIEIWHHSRIFAGCRSRVELWENWLGELLICPFCLSPYVGWLSAAVLLLLARLHPAFGIPVYGFAVARLANLGNDLTHHRCRTVRHNHLDPSATGSDVQTSKVVLELIDGNESDGTDFGGTADTDGEAAAVRRSDWEGSPSDGSGNPESLP